MVYQVYHSFPFQCGRFCGIFVSFRTSCRAATETPRITFGIPVRRTASVCARKLALHFQSGHWDTSYNFWNPSAPNSFYMRSLRSRSISRAATETPRITFEIPVRCFCVRSLRSRTIYIVVIWQVSYKLFMLWFGILLLYALASSRHL